MILRHITEHVKAQNWVAVGIDFVIVVVGVFVGIQVSNWNEELSDARRETIYLIELREDFRQIISELDQDAAQYERIANAMTLLLDQSRKPAPDIPLAELNAAAGMIILMEGTPIRSDTYENLTGSGDLSIIESRALKRALTSFFGRAGIVELVADTHEMQLVGLFQPFIVNHLDYALTLPKSRGLPPPEGFDPELIVTVLPTQEFRNVAAVKWDIVTDLRNMIMIALDDARVVDTLLTQELERRQ